MSGETLRGGTLRGEALRVEVLRQAEAELAALGPRPFPLPLGPLAPVVAAAFTAVPKGDWIVAGPRERVGAVLRGCPVQRLVDPAASARPSKPAPVSEVPGARAPHSVGLALAGDRPVLWFLGLAVVTLDHVDALAPALAEARATVADGRQGPTLLALSP